MTIKMQYELSETQAQSVAITDIDSLLINVFVQFRFNSVNRFNKAHHHHKLY